ncbi:MAG TPA: amidase, partial [Gammaproteobacteria bacterium]|nr:amidase [Gammaproteobacteria bacterium]
MKFSEYSSYDGLGLAELIAQGEISAIEAAEIAYQAIESRNPDLNAVLGTVRDQPFSEGKPFTGVPFLVKELILQAKGTFSRAGSRATP